MKSIIQQNKEKCFLCGGRASEEHHCIYGTANRKLSEKYGLKVYLCPLCHRIGENAVHKNYFTDIKVKQIAQKKFEENHTREEFIKIFGKNYLD